MILMGVPVQTFETAGFRDSVSWLPSLTNMLSQALHKLSGNSMAIRALLAAYMVALKSLSIVRAQQYLTN